MTLSCRAAACRIALVLLLPASGFAQHSYLLPPDAIVANRSQEDWSSVWWQWAASFERAESPVADETGERCAGHQSGDVWFLAGTYETKRTFRTCRVPRDRHLFFPLINYVVMPNRTPVSCEAVRNTAARMLRPTRPCIKASYAAHAFQSTWK